MCIKIDSEVIAAFVGAFSAFIFGLIAYLYDKKRTRVIQHQNAVVELGYTLNDHLDAIERNKYLVKGTLEIFKEGHTTYNRLFDLRMPNNIELRLGDLDLINETANYRNSIDRINHDFKTFNRSVELINTALIQKSLSESNLKENLNHISKQLDFMYKILVKQIDKTKKLYAYIRVYQDTTFNKRILNYWKTLEKNKKKINENVIDTELERLNSEIKETEQESKEEIENILNIYN